MTLPKPKIYSVNWALGVAAVSVLTIFLVFRVLPNKAQAAIVGQ